MKKNNSQEILFKPNTLIKGRILEKPKDEEDSKSDSIVANPLITPNVQLEIPKDKINRNLVITNNEYKLFNKILYKCQIEKNNKNQMVANLKLEELKEIVKKQNEVTPKAILETLERFMKIIIRFKKDGKFISTTLINKVVVAKDTANFGCYLDKEMFEVLMNYKEVGYSPIDLKLVRNANGYYTQRLYELFRIWSGTKKEVTYNITELKDWLMLSNNTSYDLYSNFKRRVIIPSIIEINNKLNMEVSYTENKVGRKIMSLTFTVIDKEPRVYDFNNDDNITENKAITPKYNNKSKTLKFNNFKSRDYDYDKLEKALLGWNEE